MSETQQTISTIEENVKSLEKNSDKLRENVNKIFAIFGKIGECQICELTNCRGERYHHKYNVYAGQNMQYARTLEEMKNIVEKLDGYSTKIENEKMYIHYERWNEDDWREVEKEDSHTEKNCVYVSFDIDDTEPFFISEKNDTQREYFLSVRESQMYIVVKEDDEEIKYLRDLASFYEFVSPSRKILRELVNSGRIEKFFHVIAETTRGQNKEYKQVAELAEKLASAIGEKN